MFAQQRHPSRIVFSVLIAFLSSSIWAQAFHHPGLMNSKAELDYVKAKIAGGEEPWKKAFDRLGASSVGSLTYTPKPMGNPTSTTQMDQMTKDGQAAYSHALLWYYSDNKSHASKSISILNTWASTWDSSGNFLFLTWAIPHYLNAAEILRTTNSGWTSADQAKFDVFVERMRKAFYQPGYVNNIKMTNIEAQMAIAIYQDNRAAFDSAVARWRHYAPGYFYVKTDGKGPLSVDGKSPTYWSHPISFLTDGMCQETCQDAGHMNMGTWSVFYAAEMAWQQDVDLFSEEKDRLASFLELHSGWSTGKIPVPGAACSNHPGKILCGQPNDPNGPAYPNCGPYMNEIGYSQLAIRLGIALPQTKAVLEGHRPMGTGGERNDKPQTLTHANLPNLKGQVKSIQSISFPALLAKSVDAHDFDPGAKASSGLPVSYASSNPKVATIVSGKIHLVGIGDAVITASQAGNTSYLAAPETSQPIKVTKLSSLQRNDALVLGIGTGAPQIVRIFAANGNLVYSAIASNTVLSVPARNLGGNGIYYVQIGSEVVRHIVAN